MLLGGVGDPKRGYVDYELHDGNGCRGITFISYTYHAYHIHIILHTHIATM